MSRIRVNEGHIGWADTIFVMEKKHARILREKFGEALDRKPVICHLCTMLLRSVPNKLLHLCVKVRNG